MYGWWSNNHHNYKRRGIRDTLIWDPRPRRDVRWECPNCRECVPVPDPGIFKCPNCAWDARQWHSQPEMPTHRVGGTVITDEDGVVLWDENGVPLEDL